jgi:hypothetical protein
VLAESNCEQSLAETYARLNKPDLARQHFWRAIRWKPFQLKTIVLLAFLIDGRLGWWVRRWRWRLAGRSGAPWQMPEISGQA